MLKTDSVNNAKDLSTLTYTPNGWRQQQTKPNGNTVDYAYYLDGLLKHQVEKKSNEHERTHIYQFLTFGSPKDNVMGSMFERGAYDSEEWWWVYYNRGN